MTGLAGASSPGGAFDPLRPSLPLVVDGASALGKLDTGKVRILGAPAVAPRRPRKAAVSAVPMLLLSAALVLSIFQFYVIPIGDFHFSLGLLSAYALVFLAQPGRALSQPLVLPFAALLLVEAVSLSWSPNITQGVREIVFTLPFLITFLATRRIAQRNPTVIVIALKAFTLAACLHSGLIIGMAAVPALKSAVFDSPAAGLFINQNSLDALNSGAELLNALGTDKAPGFFGNANVAGVWAATALAATLVVIHYGRSTLWIAVALVHTAAILVCGSKASVVLLGLVPVMVTVALMVFPPVGRRRHLIPAFLLATLTTTVVLGGRALLRQTKFLTDSQQTLTTRMVMWTHAWHEFQITPWLGQGFGGWTLSFAPVGYAYQYIGVNPRFPPHNSLIILWSQSGLAAALIGVLMIVLLLRIALMPRREPGGLRLAQCALGAYLFVILQAMGENYGILGEVHIQIPLAVMLGWASVYRSPTSAPS